MERTSRVRETAIRPGVYLVSLPPRLPKQITLSEIYTAAVLRALRVRFLGSERAGNGRVVFRFDDSDGRASEIVQRHRDSGIQLNSRDLCDAIGWSKNLIFEVQR